MNLLKKLHDKLTKKHTQAEDKTQPKPEAKIEEASSVQPSIPQPPKDNPFAKQQQQLESMQVDFVSMTSHELRTPITSLMGYLNTLNQEARDKLTNDQKEFLDRSIVSAQQILAIVNNILNVSKVERGAFTVSLRPVDLVELIETAVSESKILASQKNILLEFKKPERSIPKVSADNLRVSEVLNNLINNAITYSQSGGKVEVNIQSDDKGVVTSVVDNGPGIPTEAQPKIFTKFFRAQGALGKSSNSQGSGLGLFISKSIVDLHKGQIWFESEPGKGTTFHFSLPIA